MLFVLREAQGSNGPDGGARKGRRERLERVSGSTLFTLSRNCVGFSVRVRPEHRTGGLTLHKHTLTAPVEPSAMCQRTRVSSTLHDSPVAMRKSTKSQRASMSNLYVSMCMCFGE